MRDLQVQGETISGEFRNEVSWRDSSGAARNARTFRTYLPATVETEFLEKLSRQDIVVTTMPSRDNTGMTILLNLLPLIARSTPGFSGADLANLLNEAALAAARTNKNVVSQQDILVARDKVVLGLKRSGVVMTGEERRTVAYHEEGHALVAVMVPTAEPVREVTIIPRERAMGLTEQLPEGDRYLFRENYVLDRLRVLMGGRAAESFRIGSGRGISGRGNRPTSGIQRLHRAGRGRCGTGNSHRSL